MVTTIDKAGRVVIPVELRKKLGLRAGTLLDVVVDDLGVRLVRRVSGPEVVRRGKRLAVEPTVPVEERPEVDVAMLVGEERERWPV